MDRQQFFEQMRLKESFLCVGLDTDPNHPRFPSDEVLEEYAETSIPDHENRLFFFNKAIIDATHEMAVAYKLNLWFYLARGAAGIAALMNTIAYLKRQYPELFVIIDAKVGDIGNSCSQAAQAFFKYSEADAITINPYMGRDVAKPFLEYEDRWIAVLALTSNESAEEFQMMTMGEQIDLGKLYSQVLFKSSMWGTPDNTLFVVGATRPEELGRIRTCYPDHFFLVPGVGAQGGSLDDVANNGLNDQCGLLVNSSRGIIYAGEGKMFVWAAKHSAARLQHQMARLMAQRGLV